jgi:hypothetical protein
MKKIIFICCFVLFFCACETDGLNDMIVVNVPQNNALVGCPLHAEGSARGNWFFEASFPVKLLDSSGEIIAQSAAVTSDDWMTAEFVPFNLDLYYETDERDGVLIFEKDNPSGLPENDAQIQVPVRLGCDTALVEDYIRKNISTLSPVEPVLGGSWYVVSVDFLDANQVKVVFEDGHIQEEFLAIYSVSEVGEVGLSF